MPSFVKDKKLHEEIARTVRLQYKMAVYENRELARELNRRNELIAIESVYKQNKGK